MTNSSSTYLGILGGAAIGAVISWWIYNRQRKTADKQDYILQRIEKIEDKNGKILSHLEHFSRHHDSILDKIYRLNEIILSMEKEIEGLTKK